MLARNGRVYSHETALIELKPSKKIRTSIRNYLLVLGFLITFLLGITLGSALTDVEPSPPDHKDLTKTEAIPYKIYQADSLWYVSYIEYTGITYTIMTPILDDEEEVKTLLYRKSRII